MSGAPLVVVVGGGWRPGKQATRRRLARSIWPAGLHVRANCTSWTPRVGVAAKCVRRRQIEFERRPRIHCGPAGRIFEWIESQRNSSLIGPASVLTLAGGRQSDLLPNCCTFFLLCNYDITHSLAWPTTQASRAQPPRAPHRARPASRKWVGHALSCIWPPSRCCAQSNGALLLTRRQQQHTFNDVDPKRKR